MGSIWKKGLRKQLKVKLKYLWGVFLRSQSLRWTNFMCPWSQPLALCRWAPHSLSCLPLVWFSSCQHHGYSIRVMPTYTYRLLPDFVPSIIHNLTRAAYSPNGFHKLLWPGKKPATLRWESHHSNHAANPTCLRNQLARPKISSSSFSCFGSFLSCSFFALMTLKVYKCCLLYTSPSPRD